MPRKGPSTQQLVDCYSDQAAHFGHTREKSRPEFTYIGQAIEQFIASQAVTTKSSAQRFTVIELGSGTGRLYDWLTQHTPLKMDFTGIDIAPGMTKQAKKMYPQATRLTGDMNTYIKKLEQESTDIIVAVASAQHLMNDTERQKLFSYAYRALRRGGIFLMVNRSYSSRFLRRYRRQQLVAGARSLLSPSQHRNDLIIPRKDPNYSKNRKVFHRHYHIFTLHELQQLARLSGFVVTEAGYVMQDGALSTHARTNARNTWLWMEKNVEKGGQVNEEVNNRE